MTRRERWQFFFIWFFLGLVPLLMRPLWEPDEARYAEIPREMLAMGDWLAPRLNHVLYFEKPPLQYWLSAASMKLFGLNALGARLPLALATLVALLCVWRLSGRLGARRPLWAAFMAATALLGYVCGQILTLDALFSAFQVLATVAAVEAVAARFQGRGSLAWTLLAFGALALATLTKGIAAPVLVGGAFLATLPWAWGNPRLRSAVLNTLFHPLGWLLFALAAAPWFVLVERAHPGHAWFFFIHEHFARYATHVHARQGSSNALLDKLYFAGFLAVGLLPWLSASWTGARRAFGFLRRPGGPQVEGAPLHRWVVAASLASALVPFLFYSLSGSKLPPYILPVLTPILALACAFEREGEEPRALRRWGVELLVLGAVFLAFGLTTPRVGSVWILATALAFAGMGCWALRPRGLTAARLMAGLGVALLLLTHAADRVVSSRKSVIRLVSRAPREAQWITCGNLYQGIPFATGRRVAVVAGTGELAYGRDQLAPPERDRWFREDPRDFTPLARLMAREDPARPVWALVDKGCWKHDLGDEQRQAWEVVEQGPACHLVRLR